MIVIDEGTLRFTFPDDWQVLKYDDSRFYRNCFEGFANSKAVDFIAFNPSQAELHLIEVKDYITEKQNKVDKELFEIVAIKVKDTLAGLSILAHKGSFDEEQQFALQAIQKPKKRVILHRQTHNRESKKDIPTFYQSSKSNCVDKNQQNKRTFARLLNSIDSNAMLCDIKNMPKNCSWKVERISTNQAAS
ncbi:MAG: hypothetical protein VSS52_012515 [Thiotrichaceae bacterium]|nr:hypothetical protein [Thiotrichaceae bacterium]